MRRKLLDQAKKENERIGVKNIKFISMFDKNPPQAEFMITDEAQHDAADTCLALHHNMKALYFLGLTATPFRTDKIKLAFEKIISDCGVRFLIEQGYLANFDQYVVPEWTPYFVAQRYLEKPDEWGKSIFYFKNADQCYEFKKHVADKGLQCEVILGNLSQTQKDDIYTRFEEGALKALVNVYLLTEGFDAPDLQTVWVRDSGKLPTMQMSGRVLRKNPADPTKVARIVQSDKTPYPYAKTAKPREQYIWDNTEWRSIKGGHQIELISSVVIRNILPKPVMLPKVLEGNGNTIRYTKRQGVMVKKNMSTRLSGFGG
jgi:superfamily II DNA or RNA helicase